MEEDHGVPLTRRSWNSDSGSVREVSQGSYRCLVLLPGAKRCLSHQFGALSAKFRTLKSSIGRCERRRLVRFSSIPHTHFAKDDHKTVHTGVEACWRR